MPRYTATECLEQAIDRFEPETMTEDEVDEYLETAVEAANLALEAAGLDIEDDLEDDEDEGSTRKSNPRFSLFG